MANRTFLLCLPVLAVLTAVPVPSQTIPNFTGIWKLHQDTGAAPSRGPRDTVFVIEHKEPKFKYSAKGMSGFVPFSETYEFTTDGRAPADPSKLSVTGNWEGQILVMKYLKGGKIVATVRLRCSADGRQMFREAELGANRKVREVYDRQ